MKRYWLQVHGVQCAGCARRKGLCMCDMRGCTLQPHKSISCEVARGGNMITHIRENGNSDSRLIGWLGGHRLGPAAPPWHDGPDRPLGSNRDEERFAVRETGSRPAPQGWQTSDIQRSPARRSRQAWKSKQHIPHPRKACCVGRPIDREVARRALVKMDDSDHARTASAARSISRRTNRGSSPTCKTVALG